MRDPVAVRVARDFICEHGMPQPWATCTECMLLPRDEQPVPEKLPPKPKPTPSSSRASRAGRTGGTAPRKTRAAKPPPARLPRHVDDDKPELTGSCDLSYEVPHDHVPYHVSGADHDWLAISSFPRRLRADGWVYLQVDEDLVARARVRGVGFRDRRWSHGPTETASDAGAGPTLELQRNSWERLLVPLGPEGERPVKGYRYLQTEADGTVTLADDEVGG